MSNTTSSDSNLCCGLCGQYYEGKQEICFDGKGCVYVPVQLIQSDVIRDRREVTLTWVALKALDILNRHEEAAEADAGFDAGEFSAPRHSDQAQEAIRALATKFGYSCDEVHAEFSRLSEADEEEAVQ